ncbi:MAG: YlmH/Sll1252 family protein [Clostridia bacterium]|nr:YlmH/Sll1252 family protein [Clostridia bacterium]
MIENYEVLLRHIEDKASECDRNYMITSSSFLDMAQRTAVENHLKSMHIRCVFYGGFEEAERTICIFYPDYIDDIINHLNRNPKNNQIKPLRRKIKKGPPKLSHRDYLGALMALGIKREAIGDIIVYDEGADIIIKKEMESYLYSSLSSVGKNDVETEIIPIDKINAPVYKFVESRCTVPSLRLDAIIAEAFNLSRDKASQAINSGLVYINSLQTYKVDAKVKEGSKLVLRGHGKIILKEIIGLTKKERVAILIDRYV